MAVEIKETLTNNEGKRAQLVEFDSELVSAFIFLSFCFERVLVYRCVNRHFLFSLFFLITISGSIFEGTTEVSPTRTWQTTCRILTGRFNPFSYCCEFMFVNICELI